MENLEKQLLNLTANGDINRLSIREIQKTLGLPYHQKIAYHLNRMKKKGVIGREKDGNYYIVEGEQSGIFEIPLYGEANCGTPLKIADNTIKGWLKVSRSALARSDAKGVIALKASGDSMNRAFIDGEYLTDGKFVLVDTTKVGDLKDNDIVAFTLGENASIKVLERQDNSLLLKPKSTSLHAPVLISELDQDLLNIHGKVFQII